VVFPVGTACAIGTLLLISRRKGRGSLRADFGLEVKARDWTAVLMGLGWQIALIVLLLPFVLFLDSDEPAQEVVRQMDESHSLLTWAAIVLDVVILTPVIEEVMFRGILLGGLIRRVSPQAAIVVSGLIFGSIHLVGTDFAASAIPTVVGLSALGMVLAIQALRHSSLSRPILTHMGFNLAVILLSGLD